MIRLFLLLVVIGAAMVCGPLLAGNKGYVLIAIGDYTIEGHVPAADIRRLVAERPAATGLTVPGMPFGSPGMGPEAEREAYDVLLVGLDGSSSMFTSYPAA